MSGVGGENEYTGGLKHFLKFDTHFIKRILTFLELKKAKKNHPLSTIPT